MNRILGLVAFSFLATSIAYTQSEDSNSESVVDTNLVDHTFHGTRVINGHSIETLRKGVLEFRVEHRFGDIAGTNGGVQELFGFDQSSDIRIAFEYGLSDKWMIGLGRSKGTGAPFRSLVDGFTKYKLIGQSKIGSPVSVTALGTTSYSYMKQLTDITQVNAFPKWQHRLAYCTQVNIARKFGESFSLALMPTFVYRNYVQADDKNALFTMGGASRIALNSKMAILLEYYYVFNNDANIRSANTNSLGIAFEWITFGHNFTVNLTNSRGFGETQFIPYTYEKWSKGQFRLGFTIGRKFEKA